MDEGMETPQSEHVVEEQIAEPAPEPVAAPAYEPAPAPPPEPAPIPAPEPMAPPAEPEKKIPFVALIGGILMIVGIFLPWASSAYTHPTTGVEYTDSFTGMNLFGYIIMLMGILVVVGAVIKKPKMAGVFGVIGLVLALIPLALIGIITNIAETSAQLVGALDYSAGMGIGIILCFIGALIATIGGFANK